MEELLANLITIAEAARQKSCTRQTIYRAMKTGKLNSKSVAGRNLVMCDEAFNVMPGLKSSEPALKRSVMELEKAVAELRSALQEIKERVEKLEKKGEMVTKVRRR
ncbi:MAG: hypothetical protein HY808_03630 [Nitrospirae bacterium]|nr:hypothetical protein [Nitrospirota bacterium]